MHCLICKLGDTQPGTTTVTLERGRTVLVVRDVPAEVCPICGQAYVDEATTQRLLQTAEEMAAAGAEVDGHR